MEARMYCTHSYYVQLGVIVLRIVYLAGQKRFCLNPFVYVSLFWHLFFFVCHCQFLCSITILASVFVFWIPVCFMVVQYVCLSVLVKVSVNVSPCMVLYQCLYFLLSKCLCLLLPSSVPVSVCFSVCLVIYLHVLQAVKGSISAADMTGNKCHVDMFKISKHCLTVKKKKGGGWDFVCNLTRVNLYWVEQERILEV